MEWRPIETAPKDGTWIIATAGTDDPDFLVAVRWAKFAKAECWHDLCRTSYPTLEFSATHWMPLPESPQ